MMRAIPRYFLFASSALMLGIALIGCGSDGPELADVEGTVLLDGKPLEGALLLFTPTAGGRQSGGRTDAEGHYELIFSRDREGALPGKHTVMISTFQEGDPGQDIEPVPEKLPAKYNTKTELTKTVEPGGNVIDFKLDSKGEVSGPGEKAY